MSARSWGHFRCVLIIVAATMLIPATQVAMAEQPRFDQRRLELTNLHTGEKLTVTFHDERDIAPDAMAALRHLLRDYRVNEEHEMDPGLFMQLTDLAREAGVPARYAVISGYRSPATNARLHAAGHAVAEHSQHMEGRAMDVRLEDCPLSRLHDLALGAKRGGVGYYPRSNFVHIDTGRVRSWQE
jgi:uncharacterized protein YcbK (DUF882 family)